MYGIVGVKQGKLAGKLSTGGLTTALDASVDGCDKTQKVGPNAAPIEPIVDPDQPIIDAHHHLWARAHEPIASLSGRPRYLFDDLLADADGHRLIASVYVDGHAAYRADGLPEMRVVGETEFANGQAATSASGDFGPARIAAAIVSTADCRLGDRVAPVLEAQIAAGNGRFRGIRQAAAWDRDSSIVGHVLNVPPELYRADTFRAGFRHLSRLGLSFDAFVLSPQIPDVTDLARAFPNTRIVLNHVGNPLGSGRYRGKMQELFPRWREHLQSLAELPNVYVKLGGLGTFLSSFPAYRSAKPASSAQIAEQWRPYLETSIELFGARRGMIESNYPMDSGVGSYRTVMNALKRVLAPCSAEEKQAMFVGTAADFYRIANVETR
jgi:L-fuconolactonase